ncbi:hypothetical protein [Streptomyces sp. NPDC088725]|uniref:hypothetical protein n=1 Tax=Streptomyces sp. NPDC088725 TaxID=3365873 RepID=UPI0038056874
MSVPSAHPSRTPTRSALVIGGTGMLAGVVHGLVADGWRTTVVARGERSLGTLADRTTGRDRVMTLPADYSDPGGFRSALEQAVGEVGRFQLAVLWVHTPSRDDALPVVAGALTEDAVVVDVRGSVVADPTRNKPLPPSALAASPRDYRPVVLGFTDGPAGPRWLTHHEISDGVLSAARAPAASAAPDEHGWVVGRVRPWHDRP